MTLTRENRRTWRKVCSSASLSTTNTTWTDPCASLDLCSERPATNRLSHGTAFVCFGYGLVAGCCEYSSEPSGSIKGRTFLDSLRNN
jgi:hypothetical protein